MRAVPIMLIAIGSIAVAHAGEPEFIGELSHELSR